MKKDTMRKILGSVSPNIFRHKAAVRHEASREYVENPLITFRANLLYLKAEAEEELCSFRQEGQIHSSEEGDVLLIGNVKLQRIADEEGRIVRNVIESQASERKEAEMAIDAALALREIKQYNIWLKEVDRLMYEFQSFSADTGAVE